MVEAMLHSKNTGSETSRVAYLIALPTETAR